MLKFLFYIFLTVSSLKHPCPVKRFHGKGSKCSAEIKILIQGTKNAYTTLRPFDVVTYDLNEKIEGCSVGLGVYNKVSVD